jgi:hypothetical protein
LDHTIISLSSSSHSNKNTRPETNLPNANTAATIY